MTPRRRSGRRSPAPRAGVPTPEMSAGIAAGGVIARFLSVGEAARKKPRSRSFASRAATPSCPAAIPLLHSIIARLAEPPTITSFEKASPWAPASRTTSVCRALHKLAGFGWGGSPVPYAGRSAWFYSGSPRSRKCAYVHSPQRLARAQTGGEVRR